MGLFKKIVKRKSFIMILSVFLMLYIISAFDLIVINVTPSIQTGIYIRVFKKPSKNDIVSVTVPTGRAMGHAKALEKIGVIENGKIRKLKPIAALKGDTIHIKTDRIYVNDENYGQIFNVKINGSVINYVEDAYKKYDNYTLKDNEFMGLSKRTGSNDGRYEDGILNLNQISGIYKLLIPFTFDVGYCFENLRNTSKKCLNVRKYKKSPLAERENRYYEAERKN